MELELSSAAHDAMLAAAAAAHPYEVCGILFGTSERIETAVRTNNVHPSPATRFEIDPIALVAAHRDARSGGPGIAGYFHSHPNGLARPSATDGLLASGDRRVWAIVAGGEITLWRDEGGFKPLPYRLVKP